MPAGVKAVHMQQVHPPQLSSSVLSVQNPAQGFKLVQQRL